MDSSLSSSSHVAIASHFNKTNVSTWPANAFQVCSIVMQPLCASLSDCIGRRIIYLVSAFLFFLSTCLAALSSSWVGLILARCVCGLAAAGLMTMGSVVLTDLVGVKKRGHYQSLNYVNYGAGSALGSITGGAIVEHLGWSYVYGLQLPLCLLSLAMVYFCIPSRIETLDGERPSEHTVALKDLLRVFDWKGSLLLAALLLCLLFVLGTGGNVLSWTNPFILFASTLSVVLICTLSRVEAKAQKPVLSPLMLQFPFRNIMGSALLFSMIHYCVIYNVMFFFQSVRLESAGDAGAHLVIPSIAFTAISAISGTTIARLETPKPTLRISQLLLILGVLGLVAMAAVLPATKAPSAVYSPCLILPSLGVGMMAPSALLTLLILVDRSDHATVNGAFITMRSLGVFVATSVSTTMIQNVFRAATRSLATTEEAIQKLEAARLNIDSVRTLTGDLQLQVIRAYRVAFVVLFSMLLVSSIGIILAFARVSEGRLDESSIRAEDAESVVEMAELLDDKSDDGLDEQTVAEHPRG